MTMSYDITSYITILDFRDTIQAGSPSSSPSPTPLVPSYPAQAALEYDFQLDCSICEYDRQRNAPSPEPFHYSINYTLPPESEYDGYDPYMRTTPVDVLMNTTYTELSPTELASLVDHVHEMLHPANVLEDRSRINRFLIGIVKDSGQLPSSIIINHVTRCGFNPVSGGGFADVWKGKLRDIDVAMKVLRIFGEGELNKQNMRALCSEVLVWHRLRHSNVMPFFGVCKTEFAPRYALISPWMKNGHMLEYLKKYPASNRRDMMLGVAMGMEYLHTIKPTVIHGDLRAPNILIDDMGQPRISDFGLAILFDSKGCSLAQSSFRGQGSVWWQAPELLHPKRFSDIKPGLTTNSDVYAFACVCIEIFTEKALFSDLSDIQVIMEVAVNDGRSPRPPQPAEERGLSDEVWLLIQDCWAVQPAERPSMTAVRSRIQDIVAIEAR